MTASAIQGDREKCLDSGMNNYLAKPVRAQTLKALLESYLSKPEEDKEIPNLQDEAKKMVSEALRDAVQKDASDTNGEEKKDEENGIPIDKKPSRPNSVRMNTTQRWQPQEENTSGQS